MKLLITGDFALTQSYNFSPQLDKSVVNLFAKSDIYGKHGSSRYGEHIKEIENGSTHEIASAKRDRFFFTP